MRELKPGEQVVVLDLPITGHRRTPRYIIGKSGIVERLCGSFRNPEALAYGKDGLPRMRLYRVHFLQREIWQNYRGSSGDTLELELFEHWLKPVAG